MKATPVINENQVMVARTVVKFFCNYSADGSAPVKTRVIIYQFAAGRCSKPGAF
jgi:hypothetical protein